MDASTIFDVLLRVIGCCLVVVTIALTGLILFGYGIEFLSRVGEVDFFGRSVFSIVILFGRLVS